MRLLLVLLASLLSLAGTAQAQSVLDRAAETLRLDPVYVESDAERAISDEEAESLREAITREDAGPLYIAILPADAASEAGGDPEQALEELVRGVGQPGTYAVVIGDFFRAGATQGVLPVRAGGLAAESFQAESDAGTAAVLEDFVRRVGDARAAGSESGDGGGGFPIGLVMVLLLALPFLFVSLSRGRRRRKHEQAEFEQVRDVARDDVIALGQDIRALDIDMEMADVDPEAKEHYGIAVERYTQADEGLGRGRRPEDLRPVTEALEEGRWAMEAAKAEMAGRQAPERRPPCFFDPRHGPSVTDVEWAPPGGQPRPVPACAADAVRIQDGQDPDMRQVAMNGQMVPYWQAGPAFGPWAGGFFGGGLLPGLLVGSLLGGALGGFGHAGDAYAGEAGETGDLGGGDFGGGDFGGGGGDFGGGGGGGDFGGGDF